MSEPQPEKIRIATLADAAGIARVHVDSWRSTYQGILPRDFLANLSYPAREEMWRQTLGEDRQRILVIDVEGKIVGFASFGVERSGRADYVAEIYAIYLLADHQRRGLGQELFLAAVRALQAEGFESLLLWVAARNPACAFYEAMGGVVVDEKEDEMGGTAIKELAYGWQGLSVIAAD